MFFWSIAFLICCFYEIRFNHDYLNEDYLSKEKTSSIKGIFILLVFFSHFNSYATYTIFADKIFAKLISLVGQAMVTMFLFYSGYGVMESIKNKKNYVHAMPKKRILKLLIQFDVAVIIFAFIKMCFSEYFTFSKFLFALVGWENLGNSNWYIFTALVLYFITYIVFKHCKDKKRGAFLVFVASCVYILILHCFHIKPAYWYDTLLCYSMGMYYSLYRTEAEKAFKKSKINYYIALLGLVCINLALRFIASKIIVILILINITFAAIVVLITMKLSFDNKLLRWCGEHLFEIFILQRIPMMILKQLGIINNYVYLSFAICLITTLFLSYFYQIYTNKITRFILKI